MKAAFIFPGTGSQYIGMGKKIYYDYSIARHTFEETSDFAQISIRDLCFEDKNNLLSDIRYSHLAVLTCGVATYRALVQEGIQPSVMAGLSLGSYCAIVAADVLSFWDTLEIVSYRSNLMKKYAIGKTVAVIGCPIEKINYIKEKAQKETGKILDIAVQNSKLQFLLAGDNSSIDKAIELLSKEEECKTFIPGVDNIAVHSRLMEMVSLLLDKKLLSKRMKNAKIPIILNSSAKETVLSDDISKELVKQCISTVFWYQTIENMINKGINIFVESGPGEILKRLNRYIKPGITYSTNNGKEDINMISKIMI
jgi:[acyl-carrier-protein] S-malonyltransferase